ncbi:MAG: hypothetical protein R3320_08740 [Nitriliruptorales bacterium]|nr:hypothetical protein [Nitriliruptorales bacterium]
MTDELDHIRQLRDDRGPSREWVHETRSSLLEMAAEEAASEASLLDRLQRSVESLAGPRPALAAAAVVVTVTILAGAVFMLAQDRSSDAPPVATPPTTEATPSPGAGEGSPGMTLAASCTGGDGLFTIAYPEGWHTDDGGSGGGCEVFDEEPLNLEGSVGGGPLGAVTVRALPVDLEMAADPGRENREVSSETTTVAGRSAVVALWESTGAAALPEGVRSYRYLVDLDDRTLMLVTYDVDTSDFEERRRLLDAMAASLELDP